jgi:PPK2 family polyphosphate:nucleotide phosphotransferase
MSLDLSAYRVTPGRPARLAERETRDDGGYDKAKAQKLVATSAKHLRQLQKRLYAEGKQSLLLVLQAMDTAGKDSTIRRVIGPLNPQGVRVWSFKAPTPLELRHDFLWRVHQRVPAAGYIGVFNRSHYEDVLVVRVKELASEKVVEQRYDHINAFERLLRDEGTRVVKVMLHISKDYQEKRLRRRLEKADKHWKFDPGDLEDRGRWEEFQEAYDVALSRCSTEHAPWYVVPAERRWFRDLVVSQLLIETMEEMDPQFPPPTFDPDDYPPDRVL